MQQPPNIWIYKFLGLKPALGDFYRLFWKSKYDNAQLEIRINLSLTAGALDQ